MRARRWTGAALLLGLAAAAPAAGQAVRVNQSDITGPSVTTGDLLNWEPGTVQSLNCPGAWGILNEGRVLTALLDSFSLKSADPAVPAPTGDAQRTVGLLLAGGPGAAEAGARVRQALTAGNPSAGPAAARLVDLADGLLAAVARIDPRNPGRAVPTRLHRAVGAWDELIDASNAAWLASPPAEFVALGTVLGRLDRAAIEHAARPADPSSVDAFGAACAPVVLPPPKVVEQPFAVCVLAEDGFRAVEGVFLPAGGDSLVTVNGARRPLREAYPETGYALGRGWFGRDSAITVFGRSYVQWGMSRVARPGELVPAGAYQGVTVFTAPHAGAQPEVVYLPFRASCEVQPYRRVEEVRRVRGG